MKKLPTVQKAPMQRRRSLRTEMVSAIRCSCLCPWPATSHPSIELILILELWTIISTSSEGCDKGPSCRCKSAMSLVSPHWPQPGATTPPACLPRALTVWGQQSEPAPLPSNVNTRSTQEPKAWSQEDVIPITS